MIDRPHNHTRPEQSPHPELLASASGVLATIDGIQSMYRLDVDRLETIYDTWYDQTIKRLTISPDYAALYGNRFEMETLHAIARIDMRAWDTLRRMLRSIKADGTPNPYVSDEGRANLELEVLQYFRGFDFDGLEELNVEQFLTASADAPAVRSRLRVGMNRALQLTTCGLYFSEFNSSHSQDTMILSTLFDLSPADKKAIDRLLFR